MKEDLLKAQMIIEIVAKYFCVLYAEVISKDQHEEITKARKIAMYFIYQNTKLTLTRIGSLFEGRSLSGKKDHATITFAIRTVNDRIDTEPIFRQEIKELKILIKGGDIKTRKISFNIVQKCNIYVFTPFRKFEVSLKSEVIQEPIMRFVSPFIETSPCNNLPYHGYSHITS
jgi:hypothetical protein